MFWLLFGLTGARIWFYQHKLHLFVSHQKKKKRRSNFLPFADHSLPCGADLLQHPSAGFLHHTCQPRGADLLQHPSAGLLPFSTTRWHVWWRSVANVWWRKLALGCWRRSAPQREWMIVRSNCFASSKIPMSMTTNFDQSR